MLLLTTQNKTERTNARRSWIKLCNGKLHILRVFFLSTSRHHHINQPPLVTFIPPPCRHICILVGLAAILPDKFLWHFTISLSLSLHLYPNEFLCPVYPPQSWISRSASRRQVHRYPWLPANSSSNRATMKSQTIVHLPQWGWLVCWFYTSRARLGQSASSLWSITKLHFFPQPCHLRIPPPTWRQHGSKLWMSPPI